MTRLTLATLSVGLGASVAQAQVARVASTQLITEKKTGDAGAWQRAGVGAPLNVDDRFRTGKRSKADLTFTDGSLLRLGQLSSVAIRSAKGVQISGGQVMAVMLKPGRVLAGAATAEIKGSVVIIRQNPDGSYTFELHAGAVTVTSPKGTIDLRPGKGVTARADGSLTAMFNVPPLLYEGGSLHSELTQAPQRQLVYAGSQVNVRDRYQPSRVAVDENREASQPSVVESNYNPFQPQPTPHSGPTHSPFPTPFPTGPFPVPTPFPTLQSPTSQLVAQGVSLGRREFQVAGDVNTNPVQTLDAAQQAANIDTIAAQHHFDEANPALGSGSGADAVLLAALSSGGGNGSAQAYGGRIHGYSADGHWFLDLAATPLWLRFKTPGAGYKTSDFSAISNATITYRHRMGELQIGRQRFIEGPTQAALFGSLVRQGAREVMDAVRFTPNIGKNRGLDVAYLYDAFPRNLPYRVPGAQHGLYGRFSLQEPIGNFGLNLLKYQNSGFPNTTGATVDFALPVVRNQVEFYGELGRDTVRRRLSTLGLTFPGLYDKTNFDAYLEYASLRSSNLAVAPPHEIALRVYRKLGRYSNLVMGLSKFSGVSTNFTLGVSVGGRIYGEQQDAQ
ncbi:MAG: FecR domain-containing protein [Abitibacteriaceae bacterium]|nr:FecR domain-containing protein [Abditibacteriaceae bacterium]